MFVNARMDVSPERIVPAIETDPGPVLDEEVEEVTTR